MSGLQTIHGFEDVWRPPVRSRIVRPRPVLQPSAPVAGAEVRARLARIVARAPEVMVKVTGRTRDPGHLRAHLDYISRNGDLELEGVDGALVMGRREVADLAEDWATEAMADSRRRTDSPISLSVVLSMPAGTHEIALRDAARSFAADMFAGRHDYVLTLHTDTPRPHVHLAICSRGHASERLNPKKADLELWRQTSAQALRDRGVEAEATPRRDPQGRADTVAEDPGPAGGWRGADGAGPPLGLSRGGGGGVPRANRTDTLGAADRGATTSGTRSLLGPSPDTQPIRRPGGSSARRQGFVLGPRHAPA